MEGNTWRVEIPILVLSFIGGPETSIGSLPNAVNSAIPPLLRDFYKEAPTKTPIRRLVPLTSRDVRLRCQHRNRRTHCKQLSNKWAVLPIGRSEFEALGASTFIARAEVTQL